MNGGATFATQPWGCGMAAPLAIAGRNGPRWLRPKRTALYDAAHKKPPQSPAPAGMGRFHSVRLARKCPPTSGEQSFYSMADQTSDTPSGPTISSVLIEQRGRILQFLRLRGAGDAAEDYYQELWMRLSHRASDNIADPISYVMRAANNLMLDHYRSNRQREARDLAWGQYMSHTEASSENRLIAEQQLRLLDEKIQSLGSRPATVFRRFRLDNIPQKEIAAELGVSLSTVEADLRKVYAAIAATRRQLDAQ
jgi:RNA polymerase sigma-70 factor (ECF subfamily)